MFTFVHCEWCGNWTELSATCFTHPNLLLKKGLSLINVMLCLEIISRLLALIYSFLCSFPLCPVPVGTIILWSPSLMSQWVRCKPTTIFEGVGMLEEKCLNFLFFSLIIGGVILVDQSKYYYWRGCLSFPCKRSCFNPFRSKILPRISLSGKSW
jgi:hypothetical protein